MNEPAEDNYGTAVYLILYEARRVIQMAKACGVVLEIELVPDTPLAMGNYHMEARAREERQKS